MSPEQGGVTGAEMFPETPRIRDMFQLTIEYSPHQIMTIKYPPPKFDSTRVFSWNLNLSPSALLRICEFVAENDYYRQDDPRSSRASCRAKSRIIKIEWRSQFQLTDEPSYCNFLLDLETANNCSLCQLRSSLIRTKPCRGVWNKITVFRNIQHVGGWWYLWLLVFKLFSWAL